MKLTLWNDDTELLNGLDLKRYYYKISVQDAVSNVYLQREYVQTSKALLVFNVSAGVWLHDIAFFFLLFFL